MTLPEDRRHDEHPAPPHGLTERRHCSDDECRAARMAWVAETLMPQMMNRFYALAAATVLALSGVFVYMNQAAIQSHENKMYQLFETRGTHAEDIAELKESMQELTGTMSHSMNQILERLDRNYSQIKDVKR